MPDAKSTPLTPEQQAVLLGFDRLGFKLTGALARVFGSLAAKDEETYWNQIKSANGNGFVNLLAAVGDVQTATMAITQEADFVATRFLVATLVTAGGAPLATPSFTVGIVDGGSDRQLMPFQAHIVTLAGTAQLSVPFTKNRLFRRNSTVTFNFTNLQATATQVWLVAQGYKVFDERALDLVRRR